MSLRDIGNSLERVIEQFASDLELASSTSPLDWPIYLIVLALILVSIVIGVISALLASLHDAHQRYWAKHFDAYGKPTTRIGRAAKWTRWIASYLGVFIMIWFLAWVVLSTIFDGAVLATSSTIVAGVIILLAIRGRIAMNSEDRE